MDELPAGLVGLRDRALMTLGFAGGFRRSELVALDCADLKFVSEGLEALVRRSKTDQEGVGLTKVIAFGADPSTCPVRASKDWLELAGIVDGPVFRPINRHEQLSNKRLTDFAVAVIIKRTAKKAGLPTPQLSGHSLRAGFVTEAKNNGADDAAIMDQTGAQESRDGSSLSSAHQEVGQTSHLQARSLNNSPHSALACTQPSAAPTLSSHQ